MCQKQSYKSLQFEFAGDTRRPFKEGTWLAYRPLKRINDNGKQGVFCAHIEKKKLHTIQKWIQDSGYATIKNPLLQGI
jgi:hypothetical protein